ncbi:hypothetical protein [uncultured Brachyspira sp.]|uniref:hypothetical protein n=2 Tax=uncultured Brachyspira sp. TaxID=221953 RepID=UPI0025F8C39B|nr:hypothetical protein [uncultured Brachyspira sp.]
MRKIFIIILINIIYVYAFADSSINREIFITLEGSIDKYAITIDIYIEAPDNILQNKKSAIRGYYKYNNINTPIPIIGEIDKNTIIFYAFNSDKNKKEIFYFQINNSQLDSIINLGNNKKNINLKGSWQKDNKKLSSDIKTIKPLYTVYNISVSKEYKNYIHTLSALYIENLKLLVYEDKVIKHINNTNEIIQKINNEIIQKVNNNINELDLKEEETFYEAQFYGFYDGFFNDNVLCITSSIEYYYGGPYPGTSIKYLTLDINKLELRRLTLSDFVNDSDEFRKTLQKELDKYYSKDEDFSIDVIDKVDSSYAEYLMQNNVSICTKNDDIDLHIQFNFPHAARAFDDFSISFSKLKPYLKKNIYYYF